MDVKNFLPYDVAPQPVTVASTPTKSPALLEGRQIGAILLSLLNVIFVFNSIKPISLLFGVSS